MCPGARSRSQTHALQWKCFPKLTRNHSDFKQFKAPTTLTVQNVISNVLRTTDLEYCKDWVVTEVIELGNGNWDKVRLLPQRSSWNLV
jgi:hypothetical protein